MQRDKIYVNLILCDIRDILEYSIPLKTSPIPMTGTYRMCPSDWLLECNERKIMLIEFYVIFVIS